jgi:arsenate reductase
MAEGFLKFFDKELEVFSAGTKPSDRVHPMAIKVMNEIGIDISSNQPESIENYLDKCFDYVITVCDDAKESCPVFIGKVMNRLHIGFEDPANASGTNDEVEAIFRRVRDEIKHDFKEFYNNSLIEKV